MRRGSIWLRAGLLYLLYVNVSVGIWATIAPRSFYDDFPGGGRTWVSLDGPYNEHLIRDVGAWSLAMAVVIVAALWTMSRPLVVTVGVAAMVLGLPHAVYHARHSDVFDSTGDKLVSIGGLFLSALVGAAVVVGALRSPAPADP